MAESDYQSLSTSHTPSSPSPCLLACAFLRGSALGLLLPCSWTFYSLCVAQEATTRFAVSMAAFLVTKQVAMVCTRRYADILQFRGLGVALGLAGLQGAAGYPLLALRVEWSWWEVVWVWSGCWVALWSGACEMLEMTYLSESSRLKQRQKVCKRLSLTRDVGVFAGLLLGLLATYAFQAVSDYYVLLAIGILMWVIPAAYTAVLAFGFEGVSLFLRLSLSRKLDLSAQIGLLDLSILTELSNRDREHSFLHDSLIEPPRTCGLLLSTAVFCVFQFSRAIIHVALPRVHLGCETSLCRIEDLYATFLMGTGLGLLLLGISQVISRPAYDRTICGALLALSAGAWTLSGLNMPVFIFLTTAFNLVGVQTAGTMFSLVAGPREQHSDWLLFSGLLGGVAGAIWSMQNLEGLDFLPPAGLDALALVLVLALWAECLPHVEFLKKAKYFYIKELKYPEEVRQEASRRLRYEAFDLRLNRR